MANLYSQYASGTQLTAGTIVGSLAGISGLNPLIDRMNAIPSGGTWSIPGVAFTSTDPETDNVTKGSADDGVIGIEGGTVTLYAPANLPDQAEIVSALVTGSVDTEDWFLRRTAILDKTVTDTIATASVNTEDTSMGAGSIVDNGTYGYFIQISNLDTGETIVGAQVKYTTE